MNKILEHQKTKEKLLAEIISFKNFQTIEDIHKIFKDNLHLKDGFEVSDIYVETYKRYFFIFHKGLCKLKYEAQKF